MYTFRTTRPRPPRRESQSLMRKFARKPIEHHLFFYYRQAATGKGRHPERKWTITEAEFRALVGMDCHYCGCHPNLIFRHRGEELKWIGLDRQNNSGDYTIDNVVPCCKSCNSRKKTHGNDFDRTPMVERYLLKIGSDLITNCRAAARKECKPLAQWIREQCIKALK